MAALVASGMPIDRFAFFGFLPRKGKERSEAIEEIVASPATVIVFEAANRVGATLQALTDAGAGDRPVCLAREITKQFEEFKRGSVESLARVYGDVDPRGEVVLVLGGAARERVGEGELDIAAKKMRAEGRSSREVMDHLVSSMGAPRNLAYRIAHEVDS
jgi:16S rRNA (cytidine1402-2'-O)-methyltransferase